MPARARYLLADRRIRGRTARASSVSSAVNSRFVSGSGSESSASRHSSPITLTALPSRPKLCAQHLARADWWLSSPTVAPSFTVASTTNSVSGRLVTRTPTTSPRLTPRSDRTAA